MSTTPSPTVDPSTYAAIVELTVKQYQAMKQSIPVTLEVIEKWAKFIASPRVPKGTYLPDVALQVAFDVIGLSNDDALMRKTFSADYGVFYKVAVGHTFYDGISEDQDVSDRLIYVESSQGNARAAIEKRIGQLAKILGEELEILETEEA